MHRLLLFLDGGNVAAKKKVRSIRSEGCAEQQSLALQRSALGSATLSADVAAARGGRRHHLRFSGSQFRGTEQAGRRRRQRQTAVPPPAAPFRCAGRAVGRHDRATSPAARAALCSSRYLSSAPSLSACGTTSKANQNLQARRRLGAEALFLVRLGAGE